MCPSLFFFVFQSSLVLKVVCYLSSSNFAFFPLPFVIGKYVHSLVDLIASHVFVINCTLLQVFIESLLNLFDQNQLEEND